MIYTINASIGLLVLAALGFVCLKIGYRVNLFFYNRATDIYARDFFDLERPTLPNWLVGLLTLMAGALLLLIALIIGAGVLSVFE